MAETRLSRRRKQLKERYRARALERLDRAADFLFSEGAQVYVFGSLLRPAEFNEHSDVDIAIEGIPEAGKNRITSRLLDIFLDIPVEIVFLDDQDLREEIRERIRKEGRIWSHSLQT